MSDLKVRKPTQRKRRPKSAVTSSRTTRRSRSGRRNRSERSTPPSTASPTARSRWGCTSTSTFCRKHCKFCYFRVYTQQNADVIKTYVDTLDKEVELLKTHRGIQDRKLQFVYFGGGTPSYLSR